MFAPKVPGLSLAVSAAALLLCAPVAAAQDAGADNVVRNATDAFGLRVGTESIGLYDAGNVRGFSPDSAGNVRLEGLYISQQGALSDRVVEATSIRVGLNTVGLLFPAPSGIADLSLRKPAETGAELVLGIDPFTSPYLQLDTGYVSGDGRFSLAAGLAAHPDQNGAFGGDQRAWSAGFVPRWQMTEAVTLTAYADWDRMKDGEVVPSYLPDGPTLPPHIDRDVDHSLGWADWAYEVENQGVILDAGLAEGLVARAGLFRSVQRLPYDAFALLSVTPAREGEMLHVLLPATRYAALSGEASLAYQWLSGRAGHTLSLAGRGLSKNSRKGGDVELNYGDWPMDRPPATVRRDISFDQPQDRDRVRHYTLGLAYNLSWDGRLDLGAGIQKADYTKTTRPGAGGGARGSSAPWLYNAMAAWRFDNGLVTYASYSRGLEESGSAPITAVNRNTVLPAVRTTQRELGLRLGLGPLTLTSSAFDVRRPYDGVDADGVYGFLGSVRHRGVEASLSGEPVPGLSLVLGAVLLDPVVSGTEVREGMIGRRPVGQTRLQWQGSVDYAPDFLDGLSVDVIVDHRARTTARGDNLADAPAYTLVDLGLRRQIMVWEREIALRAQVQNLFDAYGLHVAGDGEYEPLSGRAWRVAATMRF
ncbi:TonB-dependent receptor [Niveispirillum sp.]|uniref:TonB-dependent receptor domain-containing protein n=1 Tax=Niveispirillum sp. TaxID=1917217 RepID=UPI001B6B70D6|nr:TonB-dependent receptor [Niveispirillum sp.]MBP7337431.1 TonB-dependent receptor [Niveispirillum sp.]